MSGSYTALLPDTAAKKPLKRFVVWHSLVGLGVSANGHPVLGVLELLVVKSAKTTESCRYVLSEEACDWPGRSFRLTKTRGDEGSDAEAENYSLFAGNDPADSRCECKGYLRHNHCKHLEAVRELLGAGKITDDCVPVNPESDSGPTEVSEWGF